MNETWILGLHITNRTNKVSAVQSVLSKFGCSIKTRLGLHDMKEGQNSSCGIVLLELTGNPEEFYKLENELLRIDGLDVKKMVFPG
jgi:hypothetical protein